MPVSSGLQKYFDAQQKKQTAQDMKKRFADLKGKIDPAFMQSFAWFHDKIMNIVDENPESTNMVLEEVDELAKKVERSHRVHELKKAQVIIESSKEV